MFSLPTPTRDRSAAALHMVRDRLLAMPGTSLKQESPLFGAIQTTVTTTLPAGTVRNWCMQPIVPVDHAGFVRRLSLFTTQQSPGSILANFTINLCF